MPYTPDIAIRLLEKDTESTLSEMDKLSLQIQTDYNRLELETFWAPEVS